MGWSLQRPIDAGPPAAHRMGRMTAMSWCSSPLVARHGAAVLAICNDDTGISPDIEVRCQEARKIIERAADHGMPAHDVVVDPLAMPVGAMPGAGLQFLELVRRLRTELKVNTTCGASNVSFGLPNRPGLNPAFLSMAIGAGLTSAIANPLEPALMQAVRGADVIMDHDEQCRAWIQAYREPSARDGLRRGRRRRRP